MLAGRDLTVGSINKHIAFLAIPAAIGFFFNTLYNLVDTLFAGSISTEAQTALGFAFPLFFVILAASVGIGQGTTALVSNAVGERDNRKASLVVAQSLVLSFLVSLVVIGCVSVFGNSIFELMGARGEALRLTQIYTFILLGSTFAFVLVGAINGALTAQGDLVTFGIALVAGTVLNIIFNTLFVYQFGWGMYGIAFATCMVQYVSLAFVFWRLTRNNIYKDVQSSDFRFDWNTQKELLTQSIPASLNIFMIAIGFLMMNRFFAVYGDAAVAAGSIANRVLQLFLLPTLGINLAVLAIGGQNFGAKLYARVFLLYRNSMILSIVLAATSGLAIWFLDDQLMALFSSDESVRTTGAIYLRYMAMALPALFLALIPLSLMQAMKRPMVGPMVNLLRLVILPFVLIKLLLSVYDTGIKSVFLGEFVAFSLMGLLVPLIAWYFMKKDMPVDSKGT